MTKIKVKKKKITTGKIKRNITTIDNIKFDSEMESKYYLYIKMLKEKGIVKEFILQPKFLLKEKFIIIDGERINGSDKDFNRLKRKYKAKTIEAIIYKSDFDILYADGHREIVDVKGLATADFKIKMKMFTYKYPDLHLRLLTLYKGTWIDYNEFIKIKKDMKKR